MGEAAARSDAGESGPLTRLVFAKRSAEPTSPTRGEVKGPDGVRDCFVASLLAMTGEGGARRENRLARSSGNNHEARPDVLEGGFAGPGGGEGVPMQYVEPAPGPPNPHNGAYDPRPPPRRGRRRGLIRSTRYSSHPRRSRARASLPKRFPARPRRSGPA